ncbi:RNA polymerase sigma factor [Nonomuraea sp. NPDC051941]|uniref:RNA polymerase sigma factor n=1 Tax=Nonomuraea sp. NPDC051941 TaxID=3364373 RepID=UPI0037C93E2E
MTFLLAFEHWPDIERPGPWLRTVVARQFQRERGRRETPMDLTQEVPAALSGLIAAATVVSEHTQPVLSLLAALPPRQRAVMAYHLDGHSIAEIAQRTASTSDNVRFSVHHARRKLAAALHARPLFDRFAP